MIIGVPREVKAEEHRVGLLPPAVYQLTQRGHRVLLGTGAGAGSGYPDGNYTKAGAEICDTPEAVFAEADLIVKVKEPQPEETPLLREGQILFTYRHPSACQRHIPLRGPHRLPRPCRSRRRQA